MCMMTFIGQFQRDLRSTSGHDPIGGGGDSHVACQKTRLDQATRLVLARDSTGALLELGHLGFRVPVFPT